MSSISGAASLQSNPYVPSFTISDTAYNVQNALTTLLSYTKLTAIFLTDFGRPTITVTGASYAADTSVLTKIISAYNLVVTGATVEQAPALQIAASSFTISDTASHVQAGLAALVSDTKLTAITLTDSSKPSFALTGAAYAADASALAKIISPYTLDVTAATVDQAAALQIAASSFTISDTAANVQTALTALVADTKLTTITLTDAVKPTLTLTGASYAAGAAALAKIAGDYYLAVTAATVGQAAALQTAALAFTISDTAANVQNALTALVADTRLTAITLTDAGKPTITITGAAYVADTAVLAKITTAYNLAVTGASVGQAAALQTAAWAFTISDTAGNVQNALTALVADTKLTAITLTDAGTPTITLTGTGYAANTSALAKIISTYSLVVTGATAGQAAALQSAASSFTISDTAANVQAGLAGLVADTKLTTITLTDGGTPTMTLTGAAYAAGTAALAKITNPYNLVVTGATVAQAAALQIATSSFTISDTAANVQGALTALLLDTKLTAITLTDAGTPTITLTAAAYAADTAALAKITSPYYLAATAATVGQAAALQTSVSSFTISDTASNVQNALSALVADTKLTAILLTDAATPTITLTGAAYAADTAVLAKITSSYSLIVTGATVGQAAALQSAASSFTISDTAANVQTALTALVADTKLTAITLTDSGKPTITLTGAAYAADTAALAKIISPYNLAVTAATVGQAAALQSVASSFTISDTASTVQAALTALVADTKLTAITLTDAGTPTIALTAASYAAYTSALAKITSTFNLAITAATVDQAAALQIAASSFTISDTAVNVQAGLTALLSDTKLTAITLTDSGKPTITLTGLAYAADASALAKIISPYNLAVTAATVGQAAALQIAASSFTISDTAANVQTALTALVADTKLTAITLTDAGTPTITLTGASYAAGAAALAKIAGAYNLAVTAATIGQAAALQTAALAFTISDTAANVQNALTALAADTRLTAITLTDAGTPTITLTGAAYAAGTAALAKITTAYNLAVTGASVGQAAALQTAAWAFTISDTASTVQAALAALVADTKLTAITLTDAGRPTITLTATAYAADTVALAKITSAYSLVVTGATVGQAAALQIAASSFTISDTAANVQGALSALLADTKLTTITLTEAGTPTITLTAAAYAANTAALAKIGSPYNLAVTAATVGQAAALQIAASSFTISDTAANVQGALTALLSDTKLTAIILTDAGTPTISLTGSAYAADTAVLAKITSSYNLAVTAATIAQAAALQTAASSFTISDTAANVQGALTALLSDTKLTAITLTDASKPTMTLTAAAYAADTAALAKITSAYNLSVTAATVGQAAALQTAVSSFSISDTAANVQNALGALLSYSKLTAITLTDAGKPTITLTAAAYAADTAALAKITSAYNLSVTAATVGQAAALQTAASSFTISDTAFNVQNALTALLSDTKLTAITLTDAGKPTITLTASAYAADTAVLAKITTACNLAVTAATVDQAAALQIAASSFTISDTSANVQGALTALLSDTKLSAITLTDAGKPTITLTAAAYAADTAALAKITSAYNLAVTGASAGQAAALQTAALPYATIGFAVSDNVANVKSRLASLLTYNRLMYVSLTDTAANITSAFSNGISGLPVNEVTLSDNAPVLISYNQWNYSHNLVSALKTSVNIIVDQVDPYNYYAVSLDPHVTSVVTTSGLSVPLDQAEYLYIAYFGRAAEPGGLGYWAGLLNGSTDLHNAAMGFGTTAEAATRYALFAKITANLTPTSDDITTFVTSVYQNLLNRAPDPGGLAYWASIIQSRLSIADSTQRALQIGAIPADLIGGAFSGNNAGYRLDQATLQNKVGEAEAISAKMALIGSAPNAVDISIPLIASIDASIASLTSAKALGDGILTGQSGLTASNVRVSTASIWQADTHVASFTVKDTAPAVTSALSELIRDSKLTSVTVSGTPTGHSLDLKNLTVASTIMLDGNSVSVSAGLGAPSLTFIGTPDTVTLGSAPATIQYSLQPGSGIETIANFHYGLDQLNIDLLGAINGALQASDTTLNGTAAISLYGTADPRHGVVLLAGGTSNFTTAADLLANHVTFAGGHALIS